MKLEILHRAPVGAARYPHPLLFIHGSYCAAWVWDEYFLPYFAAQGFDSYAISLRGHGSSEGREGLKKARIWNLVADVRQAAESLPAKPVLLGHSLGGGIVEKAMEADPTIPAGVLIAPAPYRGVFTSAISMIRADPRPLFEAMRRRKLSILSGAVTRAHMMANVAPEARAGYLARLEPEEAVRAIVDLELHKTDPRKIHAPVLLIGGGSDQMVLPYQIEETGRVFHLQPQFFPGMGHEMMLEPGWQNVADAIIGWLCSSNNWLPSTVTL